MSFIPPVASLSLIREGKIRPIAVTSLTRAPFLPDIPTIAESGYPGFDVTGYEFDEDSFDALRFMTSFAALTKRPTVLVAPQAEAIGAFETAERTGLTVARMVSLIAIRDDDSRPPTSRLPLAASRAFSM